MRTEKDDLYATLNLLRLRDSKKRRNRGDILQALSPQIKGILFDKDGTLLQFTDLWIHSTRAYPDTLDCTPTNRKNCELALGLEHQAVRENSPSSSGTLDQILQHITPLVSLMEPQIETPLFKFIKTIFRRIRKKLRATRDLSAFFRNLKEKNTKLGVLTSEDEKLAKQAFSMLGISDEPIFIDHKKFFV